MLELWNALSREKQAGLASKYGITRRGEKQEVEEWELLAKLPKGILGELPKKKKKVKEEPKEEKPEEEVEEKPILCDVCGSKSKRHKKDCEAKS